MITVPQKVEEIINRSSYLKDGIAQDLINLSSLARRIQPEVEESLIKDVSIGSIVMALKRMAEDLKNTTTMVDYTQFIGDITVRSGLFENTYRNSENLYKRLSEVITDIQDSSEIYFTFTKGVWETTIICSKTIENKVDKNFKDENLIKKFQNLSAVTIKFQNGHIDVPGVCEYPLKLLAWEGVNIIEAVSTYTELTIILKDEDVERGFSVLRRKS